MAQAAVLNVCSRARARLGDSLVAAMNNGPAWKRLVREVAEVVRIMPLWKLQTVGREHLDFLYANTGAGNTITLRPGIAFCFRKFHPLISDLVRGAWGRLVRQRNLGVTFAGVGADSRVPTRMLSGKSRGYRRSRN